MEITFEARRLYVAPRKSVLFFARVGDQRVRCYVEQDALTEPPRALREDADLFQRCCSRSISTGTRSRRRRLA